MIYVEEKKTVKQPGMTSLFIHFDYRKEIVDAIKTIPQALFDKKTKIWEVSTAYLNDVLDLLCVYDTIEVRLLGNKPPKVKEQKLHKYKTKPFDYQIEGIQYGLNHDKWLLLDEPGLGKTLQIIYIAQELKKMGKIEHCLIICGINNLKSNWKKEIEKHSDLSCRILGERTTRTGRTVIGSTKERAEQLLSPIKEFFVITNIETLRSDDIMKAFKKTKNKFDMMVVDEIHACKSPTSAQGAHLLKLKNSPYKIGATGTILMNSPLDAYVPLKWIGAERATYTLFKYFYCNYDGPFHNILMGFKNIDVLKNQLDNYSLRRKKDLLNLPPKMIIDEYVDMDDAQDKFYQDIKHGIKEQVDKVKLTTTNLLAMVTRLRQATACPSILTTEDIPSAKIDRCIELAKQVIENGHKVVVFSTFKETLAPIMEALSQYNPTLNTGDVKDIEVAKNIDKFQSNKDNKVFLATWQRCGTGITLTEADYMIFLDTPWTAAVFNQACDRIYRIGTKNSVVIYNLITTDTVDERVHEIVTDKEAIADYVVDDVINEKTFQNLKKYIQDL